MGTTIQKQNGIGNNMAALNTSKNTTANNASNSTSKSASESKSSENNNDPLGTGQTDALKTYIDGKMEKIQEEIQKGLKSGKLTKGELSSIDMLVKKAYDNIGKAMSDDRHINRTENTQIREAFSKLLDTVKSYENNGQKDGL